MKKFSQTGFGTLQWLLMVGVIGLLSVVAYVYLLPAYRDNQVQKKLTEVFVSVDACKADVAQVVQKTSAPVLSTALFSCDGGASSGVKISRHLKSIAVGPTGGITVTLDYHSLLELTPITSTLTLVPLVDASTALRAADVHKTISAWRCGNPKDGTTIPSKYLPSNCRG